MVPTECRSSPRRLLHLVVVQIECCSNLRYLPPFYTGGNSNWNWQFTSERSDLSASRLAVTLFSCATPKRLEEIFLYFDGSCNQPQVSYTTKVSAGVWSSRLTIWSASFITALFQDVRMMRVESIRRWLIEANKEVRMKKVRLRMKRS